jgi:hypothetical protein
MSEGTRVALRVWRQMGLTEAVLEDPRIETRIRETGIDVSVPPDPVG